MDLRCSHVGSISLLSHISHLFVDFFGVSWSFSSLAVTVMEAKDKYSDTGSGSLPEKKSHFASPAEAEHGEVKTVQLKRRLQSRHLQMIAIGM